MHSDAQKHKACFEITDAELFWMYKTPEQMASHFKEGTT